MPRQKSGKPAQEPTRVTVIQKSRYGFSSRNYQNEIEVAIAEAADGNTAKLEKLLAEADTTQLIKHTLERIVSKYSEIKHKMVCHLINTENTVIYLKLLELKLFRFHKNKNNEIDYSDLWYAVEKKKHAIFKEILEHDKNNPKKSTSIKSKIDEGLQTFLENDEEAKNIYNQCVAQPILKR